MQLKHIPQFGELTKSFDMFQHPFLFSETLRITNHVHWVGHPQPYIFVAAGISELSTPDAKTLALNDVISVGSSKKLFTSLQVFHYIFPTSIVKLFLRVPYFIFSALLILMRDVPSFFSLIDTRHVWKTPLHNEATSYLFPKHFFQQSPRCIFPYRIRHFD